VFATSLTAGPGDAIGSAAPQPRFRPFHRAHEAPENAVSADGTDSSELGPGPQKVGVSSLTALMGSTDDLADDQPRSRIDRILQWVPRLLSSKPHVLLLLGLGVYLIVLPLAGVRVSANTELIGGNYTNVTSDIGACIAAGGTLHLISQDRKRKRIEEERLMLARQTHRLLHHVYGDVARELGHTPLDLITGRHQEATEEADIKPAPGNEPQN
jgi:hypothetical protein